MGLRRASRLADLVVVAGVALSIIIALTGGGTLAAGGLRLSVRSIGRPLIAAAIALAIRAWIARRRDETRLAVHALRLAFATCLTIAFGLAIAWQVRACGGLDSYGYVSAAAALLSGHLIQPEPLAAILPFESGIRALAPLGWVPAPGAAAIVPRFPLGFPALMAPFLAVSRTAAFSVPLLCAAMTVWIAARIAREHGSWIDGALAALLVASDPVFFNQAIQPMSDVPATMWMVLAVWFAIGERPRPLVSGIAAGLAVLTRPVLLVAVVVIGLASLVARRGVSWVSGATAFLVAAGVIQFTLFGNALSSGYGSAEHLFQLARVPMNLSNYAHWMFFVYGMLLVVMVAAPFVIRERWAWTLAATAAAVAAPYLLYVRFDDWEVTRFLLPGSTLLLIVAAVAIVRGLTRVLRPSWIPLAALVLALAAGARSYRFVTSQGVQRLAQNESKYPLIGEWFLTHSPGDAIVVASLHSGSVRFYGRRKTVRWDEIPADRLIATVQALARAGHTCYLALDGPEEEELFRARFASADLSRLTFLPAGRLRGFNIVTIVPIR